MILSAPHRGAGHYHHRYAHWSAPRWSCSS